MTHDADPTPRASDLCAHDSRRAGEDLIGSAGRWDHAFRIELSLGSWDRFRDTDGWSPARRDLMTRIAERTRERGFGFGLLLTATDEAGERIGRVSHFARPARQFARYVRTDHDTDERGLLDLMEAALLSDATLPERAATTPVSSTDLPSTDLHVCTHGRVDAACGKLGYPLFADLRDRLPEAGVWRSGHFGGHRFAPTLTEMPAGRVWGHLSASVASAIVRRTLSVPEAARHLRGWSGLNAWEQIADRAVFLREGWDWLDTPRAGITLRVDGEHRDPLGTATPPDEVEVRLDFTRADGTSGAWHALIRPEGHVLTRHTSADSTWHRANRYAVVDLRLTLTDTSAPPPPSAVAGAAP